MMSIWEAKNLQAAGVPLIVRFAPRPATADVKSARTASSRKAKHTGSGHQESSGVLAFAWTPLGYQGTAPNRRPPNHKAPSLIRSTCTVPLSGWTTAHSWHQPRTPFNHLGRFSMQPSP